MTTELAPTNGSANGIAAVRREIRPVQDDGPLAFMMDTAKFEHMNRVAIAMAASVFLPMHLQGRVKGGEITEYFEEKTIIANCFRVLNQAMRWGVDPFAVCDETYVVGGKLAYQGKLVAAIVNSRAGLKGRLTYKFDGQGQQRRVKVIGTFREMDEACEIELTVEQGKTQNQMWTKDPDQKLVYSGVVKWARRFCPEIIMGVMTDDDLDRLAHSSAVPESSAELLPTSSLSQVMAESRQPTSLPAPAPAAGGSVAESSNPPAEPEQQDGGAGEAQLKPAALPDISTVEKFKAEMLSLSIDKRMPPSNFDALMKALTLGDLPLSRHSSREKLYAAFRDDQLTPDGKIIQ